MSKHLVQNDVKIASYVKIEVLTSCTRSSYTPSYKTEISITGENCGKPCRLYKKHVYDANIQCLYIHSSCGLVDLTEWFLARLYKSTGRAIAVTTVLASASTSASALALRKMLNFLVKVFKSLYLLNPMIDLLDTLPDVRYWSEVLCYTITTHISDLEVKSTDFEILS